jgi:hypothetical protein
VFTEVYNKDNPMAGGYFVESVDDNVSNIIPVMREWMTDVPPGRYLVESEGSWDIQDVGGYITESPIDVTRDGNGNVTITDRLPRISKTMPEKEYNDKTDQISTLLKGTITSDKITIEEVATHASDAMIVRNVSAHMVKGIISRQTPVSADNNTTNNAYVQGNIEVTVDTQSKSVYGVVKRG